MNHFRIILIIQIFWIISAISRLVGYFTQTSWLISAGFVFTRYFYSVGSTEFFYILPYSIFSIFGYIGLTYLALIILYSNDNNLVIKLHRTVPGLIYLSISQVLTMVIGMLLGATSLSNQLGWYLLASGIIYYLFLITLLFITIQTVLIRVYDRRQRFYKWVFIIYPPATYYTVIVVSDLTQSYYNYVYPDIYRDISTTFTGLLLSVLLLVFVLVLQSLVSKDLDHLTLSPQLTYPTATRT